MSGTTQNSVPAGANQARPADLPTASNTEPQVQEPKPLDEARVIQLAEEISRKTAQSLVDKAEYRISQKAQQQIQALELNKVTLGLDDRQVQEAKLKIITEDVTLAPRETQASNSAVSANQPMDESVTEATFIKGLFEATGAGAEVTPNDAEWAEFYKVYAENYNDPSMQAMIKVTRAADTAAHAKANRTKNNTDAAAARVMQGGDQTQQPTTAKNASALWSQAYKK